MMGSSDSSPMADGPRNKLERDVDAKSLSSIPCLIVNLEARWAAKCKGAMPSTSRAVGFARPPEHVAWLWGF